MLLVGIDPFDLDGKGRLEGILATLRPRTVMVEISLADKLAKDTMNLPALKGGVSV